MSLLMEMLGTLGIRQYREWEIGIRVSGSGPQIKRTWECFLPGSKWQEINSESVGEAKFAHYMQRASCGSINL